MDIDLFFLFSATTGISICNVNICNDFYIVVNLLHALNIMRLPMFEIQYDDAYLLIDALKNNSLRIKKIHTKVI